MSDFISGFFSWGKPKEEPIDPREKVIVSKRKKLDKIVKPKIKTEEE
jgi:hypothetical protein